MTAFGVARDRDAKRTTLLHPALLALAVMLASRAAADEPGARWAGSIGVGAVGSQVSGSEESFRTQHDSRSGLSLESLLLERRSATDPNAGSVVQAWGFGGAEPSQHARFRWSDGGPWGLKLDYDRRRSFFALRDEETLSHRRDDWSLTSWHGRVKWDGLRAATVSARLHRTTRSGSVERPFYGLSETYPLRVALDDATTEAAVRLETKTLPVRIELEQSWIRADRRDRYSPAGETAIAIPDPDELAGIATTRNDRQSGPSTVLTASGATTRMELLASAVYMPVSLETRGVTATTFAVDGGARGSAEMVDLVASSADRATTAATLRLGLRLTPSWTLRLDADHRDANTDGRLLGERLLRLANPDGPAVEFRSPVDDGTRFESTDQRTQLEIAWSRGAISFATGGFEASRTVRWNLAEERETAAGRDSTGTLFRLGWQGAGVSASVEHTRGTFERSIFRTDPQTVDRTSLRIRARLGKGWEIHSNGRFENSSNPQAVAGLDHDSASYGAGLAWTSADGGESFGVRADSTDLRAETGVLPAGGATPVSIYDLSLLTATAYGNVSIRGVAASAAATRVRDRGETWPVASWTARARLVAPGPRHTDVAVFGEYSSWDQDRGDLDDFDVFRYGIALVWRFD